MKCNWIICRELMSMNRFCEVTNKWEKSRNIWPLPWYMHLQCCQINNLVIRTTPLCLSLSNISNTKKEETGLKACTFLFESFFICVRTFISRCLIFVTWHDFREQGRKSQAEALHYRVRAIRGVPLGVVNFTLHFIVIQIFTILFLPPVPFHICRGRNKPF